MLEKPVLLNNRYMLEERQGSGGMAMVYRARDLMLERTVAVKILRKSYAGNPEFRERFRLEAKAAANLSHPNIATVHDFGLDSDQLFFVMEYIPGMDMKALIKQRGFLPVDEAIELISQACAGVGYAHRAGLVHCDLKPQNILITPDRRVKVVDFGIARALSTIHEDEQVEVVWGSPQYFSPEQSAGSAPSPASDVYSLGVVFFEMLTGRVPFVAATSDELARLHQEALPPSPSKLKPSIPVPLERVLLKVLAKEPTARYRTADQFGRVLLNIKTQLEKEVPPSAQLHDPGTSRSEALTVAPRPAVARQPVEPPGKPAPDGWASAPPPRPAAPFDWLTYTLALIALIAAGGLVPFWLWVFYRLSRPF